jgi:hypothetical protein
MGTRYQRLLRSPPAVASLTVLLLLGAAAAVIPLSLGDATVASAISSVAATLALLGAAASLLTARSSARQQRTYSYAARANAPSFLNYSARTSNFLRLERPPARISKHQWERLSSGDRERVEEVWDSLEDDLRKRLKWRQWELMEAEEKADTMVYLNFLEEVGGAYNLGLLHKPSAKVEFAPVAETYWDIGKWFIFRLRGDAEDDTYFREWERMLQDLDRVKV